MNADQILENSEGDKMEWNLLVFIGADMDRKNGETIPESSGMMPNVRDLTRI